MSSFITNVTRLCALALLLSASAAAGDAMPAPYTKHLQAIFTRAHAPGMVAVIIATDRSYFASYGEAKAGEAPPPNERSLVRINSISKVMTGEILAALVAQGRVRLNDPLQSYAPRGRVVPQYPRSRAITLRDITLHLSGLPRDLPSSLAQVTIDERWDWLKKVRLARAPGNTAQYSNAAYLFLGDALARAAGTSYPALLAAYVSGPLALQDTTLTPTKEQCSRLMTNEHDVQACGPTRETAATAGVYSTASDMAHWMRAQLDAQPNSPRANALQPVVKRGELNRLIAMDMAGRTEAIGFGWLHMRLGRLAVIQKTGGGGGFMNYVILAPSRRLGIFITVTRTDIEMLRGITAQANALMVELANVPSLQP